MSTKPLVPTGEIPRNSNAAEYVRSTSEAEMRNDNDCLDESVVAELDRIFERTLHDSVEIEPNEMIELRQICLG